MDYCYIGAKKCGCVVAATVDNEANAAFVADDVAEFIRSGYTVSRVPIDEARTRLTGCKHSNVNQQAKECHTAEQVELCL